MESYSRGRRGAPAKGVDVLKACEGSNPSLSAKAMFAFVSNQRLREHSLF